MSMSVGDFVCACVCLCVCESAIMCACVLLGWLAVWLSSNALASINVVALRQTRLLLGWVTVSGWVNHLGM